MHIFDSYEEKKKKWQKRMMYVMVDEFQDVSNTQYELVTILSEYHKNLFVVGDPDQTIYSWRGANIEYILDFDTHFKDATTIVLDKNYRSSKQVLDASNSLIAKNKNRIEKELQPASVREGKAVYFHGRTSKSEAEWIGKNIKTLHTQGVEFLDIAILYRSHFVSRSLEEIFIKEKIPYVLYSGVEFYKRKEIKDVLSYLRMVLYGDDLSFLRVVNEPKRNIGKKRIAILQEYADHNNCTLYNALKDNMDNDLIASSNAKQFVDTIEKYAQLYKEMSISNILSGILDESGYEAMLRQAGEQERLDNLSELKQSIFEFEKNSGEENLLEDYMQSIALFTNMDHETKKNSVKMMTIHTAKGLEFPYVFVCGLNEGIFPNRHVDTMDELEEERRLAYVAYTRAENSLFLSDSEGINFDTSFKFPSRFIFNVDQNYLEYVIPLNDKLVKAAQKYITSHESRLLDQEKEFAVGDKVSHKVFGEGVIIHIDQEASSYTIKFDKIDTERNVSFEFPLVKVL